MTSAEERAKKIANKLIVSRCTGEPEFLALVDFIAAQIAEAEREALSRELGSAGEWHKKDFCERTYTEGWTAAREKAAGIAKTFKHKEFGVLIAERIREMEPGE
jgi:hypothetical protein